MPEPSSWQRDCLAIRISLLGVSSKLPSGTINGGSISKRRDRLSDLIPLIQLAPLTIGPVVG